MGGHEIDERRGTLIQYDYYFFLIIYLFYFWLYWVFICCVGFSLVVASRRHSLAVVPSLLTVVASLVEHRV